MENFIKKLKNFYKAGYPVLLIQTHEEKRLEEKILLTFKNKEILSWDMIKGLYSLNKNEEIENVKDIIEAILKTETLPDESIYIIKDLHFFFEDAAVVRAIKTASEEAKKKGITILIPSPTVKIPIELEKDITVLEMPLPTETEIEKLAKMIVKENNLKIQVKKENIMTAKGLTINEAENAIALSIIMKHNIDKHILEEQKLQAVKKSGLLEIYKPVNPDEIGGLENLKTYIKNRKKGFENLNLPTPKGILLTGIPGTGKSLSAKATASILGFPLVKLDISGLKSSLVGESEAKLREALKLIDAIAPVVVWIDEIEKALGGVLSSNRTDGGTTASMFGYLLTWMQESETPKYIVATSNDIEELLQISHGALIRRFDDVFFVDIPDLQERKEIIKIMNRKYNAQIPEEMAEKMENWTGAEIEKFVISSLYDGIDEALKSIKPIYLQNKEKIEKLKKWAKDNARIANKKTKVSKTTRKIDLDII
ncbi:AAA family ATPase [Persephonella sp. KM09-Lau-8]|uniref:AAA family ATPase n=1 Tax=Persephonella sp. KM09-Lau-8 TaxID=1158345 RepID=UPI00056A7572|nr:AAA family ATPase [Persephonella sp. KM09-Lau-8]